MNAPRQTVARELPDLDRAYGGGRLSAQRRAIAATICELPGAFTVEELTAASSQGRGGARAGTATVYRAVGALEASGWLERVGERDGRALFTRCSAGDHHHHHLVCERCGHTEPTNCPVAVAPDDPSTRGGFVVTRHEVTLYGLCARCAARLQDAG